MALPSCEPKPVATPAEVLRHGRDEADLTLNRKSLLFSFYFTSRHGPGLRNRIYRQTKSIRNALSCGQGEFIGEKQANASLQFYGHRDRRPRTSACPGCWAMGTNKNCAMRKIIFCTGLTRAAKARQKSSCIVPARRVQRTKQGWIPLFSIL